MTREVRRVLRPGGVFGLLDFGGPESGRTGFLARLIHSSHHLRDNSADRILALMSRAGFAAPKKVGQGTMFFGRVRTNFYQASVASL
jgi:ubiquinone/menaquinone biosynthesis C-methylase UbiE